MAHRWSMPHRSAGFTLLELMVTIALAAIVLGIGVPSFSSFIAGQRVKTAAAELANTAVLARSEAIKRNANVVISPKVLASGWISGWTITSAGGDVLGDQEALAGLAIAVGVADPATVTYTPSGRPLSAASFSISGGSSDPRCVRIDLSGMPSTRSGACS